jgi:lysophospholipase L1-like esterase
MSISPKMRIAAAALVLACGIGTTACDKLGLGEEDPTAPSPPAPGTPIRYTAVGASDVAGYGSSAPCLVLFGDCPESKGYVFVAAGRLRSDGYTVFVTNRGIPTATISQAFQQLGLQHGHPVFGNLLDGELPFVPRESTVVTVFAGGNDVNVITAALGGGAGAGNQTAFVDQQVQNFVTDYQALVDGIRGRIGSSGRIIALNLPNLSRLPFAATAPLAQRQAVHRAAVGMTTTAINPMAARGVRVIDLMCLAGLYAPGSLSSDGFHPSDAGYALIAAEVVRAVTASSFPSPQASCQQMTM